MLPVAVESRMTRLTICKPAAWLMTLLLSCSQPGPIALAQDHEPTPEAPQPSWPSLQSLLKLPNWIELDLDFTAEPLAAINPELQSNDSAAWMQQLVLSSKLSTGLSKPVEQWTELDHWSLAVQLTSFSGNPNLNLTLGTAFPLQTVSHPIGVWLTEASLKRSAGSGTIDIKAGLLPLNPGFVEAPSLDNYIHSALNDTLNLLIPGLPINPFLAPGAELHWRNAAGSEWRFGSYWLQNETALAGLFGVNPGQPAITGSLQIVQWNFTNLPGRRSTSSPIQTAQGSVERQLPAPLLQLGAFTTTASSTMLPPGGNQGLYGTLTLPLRLPIGLDNRVWAGFNRGFNPQSNPTPVFLALGWLNQGLIPERPSDVLALGWGSTWFSSMLYQGLNPESVLEINYTIALSSQLSLQPVLQIILQPGGQSSSPPVLAAGAQINLSF